MVELLLKLGINPNIPSTEANYTALMQSASSANLELVKLLIEALNSTEKIIPVALRSKPSRCTRIRARTSNSHGVSQGAWREKRKEKRAEPES